MECKLIYVYCVCVWRWGEGGWCVSFWNLPHVHWLQNPRTYITYIHLQNFSQEFIQLRKYFLLVQLYIIKAKCFKYAIFFGYLSFGYTRSYLFNPIQMCKTANYFVFWSFSGNTYFATCLTSLCNFSLYLSIYLSLICISLPISFLSISLLCSSSLLMDVEYTWMLSHEQNFL